VRPRFGRVHQTIHLLDNIPRKIAVPAGFAHPRWDTLENEVLSMPVTVDRDESFFQAVLPGAKLTGIGM
jgi:hypothetical protein